MNTPEVEQNRLDKLPASPASVTVVAEENKTINDLKAISAKHYVLFTPHVGNKWREDLYLLQYGITTANFERNASGLDDLDFPEKLRVGGATHDLAIDQQLTSPTVTPYLQFRPDLDESAQYFVRKLEARKPGHLHHKSTIAAIGKNKLITSAEAFFHGSENRLLRDLLNSLHLQSLQEKENDRIKIFSRYIDGQGRLLMGSKDGHSNSFDGSYHYGEDAPTKHFHSQESINNFSHQFLDFAKKLSDSINTGESVAGLEGPVPRNELMVLLLALKPLLSDAQDGEGQLDLDEKGRYHAYAVSGPSMIKYAGAKDFRATMTAQYSAIRELAEKHFGKKLPAELVLHMIPGGSLGYLPVQGETQTIDAIKKFCEADSEYRSLQSKISAEKCKPAPEVKVQLGQLSTVIKDAVLGIVEATVASPHVSQYDLLSGQKLLPESELEELEKIPFKQHIIISNLLDEARKKLKTSLT